MSELGNKYKQATEEVLNRYRTEKDGKGRSQLWKIVAMEEDRLSGNNNSQVLVSFMQEVETLVNELDSVKVVVKQNVKKVMPKQRTVSAEPIEPASPDTSSHGIDLGWD